MLLRDHPLMSYYGIPSWPRKIARKLGESKESEVASHPLQSDR